MQLPQLRILLKNLNCLVFPAEARPNFQTLNVEREKRVAVICIPLERLLEWRTITYNRR
jgi:hypothetical protein